MQNSENSGLDRVRSVLRMRVADAADLVRFSASIADFSAEELIHLANELPRYERPSSRGADRSCVAPQDGPVVERVRM